MTYEPPAPVIAALDVWGALLTARSATATVEVVGHRGVPAEKAEGRIDTASRRTALTVAGDRPYEEVTDRAVAYVRKAGGRWYRYTGAAGPGSRALRLLTLLSSADPLTYDGMATVAGVPTTRYVSTASGEGRLDVYVGLDGFARRIELHAGNVIRLDLAGFLLPPPVVPPMSSRLAGDVIDAMRQAGVA